MHLNAIIAGGILIALLLCLSAIFNIRRLHKQNVELLKEVEEYRRFVAKQKEGLDYKPVEPHTGPLGFLVDHKRGKRDRRGPSMPP